MNQPAPQPETAQQDEARLVAAHEHVESMVPRCDSENPYPLWHGWALRESFETGAKWQLRKLALAGIASPAAALAQARTALEAMIASAEDVLDQCSDDGICDEMSRAIEGLRKDIESARAALATLTPTDETQSRS